MDPLEIGRVSQHVLLVFFDLPCREVSYLPCKEVSDLPCREVSYFYRLESVFDLPCREVSYGYRLDNVSWSF